MSSGWCYSLGDTYILMLSTFVSVSSLWLRTASSSLSEHEETNEHAKQRAANKRAILIFFIVK